MEAFEQVVKVYLEDKGYIVTGGIKFPLLKRIEKKSGKIEIQRHGYEVDIVGARYDSLLLGSVKSFFGSKGVNRQGFRGIADEAKRTHFNRYTMFNDPEIRTGILDGAAKRYGYPANRIQFALFVGKFYRADEIAVRDHLQRSVVGRGPIQVVGLQDLVGTLRNVATRKTYINDAVVMTLKVLHSANLIKGAAAVKPLKSADLEEFASEEIDEGM